MSKIHDYEHYIKQTFARTTILAHTGLQERGARLQQVCAPRQGDLADQAGEHGQGEQVCSEA